MAVFAKIRRLHAFDSRPRHNRAVSRFGVKAKQQSKALGCGKRGRFVLGVESDMRKTEIQHFAHSLAYKRFHYLVLAVLNRACRNHPATAAGSDARDISENFGRLTDGMAASMRDVTENIASIAESVNQVAQTTTQIAENMTGITDKNAQIADAAQKNKTAADELMKAASRFKTDK